MKQIMRNIVKGVGAVSVTFGLALVNEGFPFTGYPLITFGLYLLVVELKD